MSLFTPPAPRWFSIAAHRPFVADLAGALHAELSPHGPEALADALVLTPTRRAARALAEAFVLAAGGGAILPPQIRAIGDLDEGEPPFEPGDLALDLPPAIGGLRRRFELARLVGDHDHLLGRPIDAPAALELASALGSLLDSLQIEEVEAAGRIDALVEGELARHWQVSADFLRVATEAWPARLAALGLADVNARRIALLRRLGEQWRERPPERPLIAAGSTGTAPAAAALLAAVAAAPRGAVVLPGLDLDLADSAWAEVRDGHPQATMKHLLDRAGVPREAVRPWPCPETPAEAARGRARRQVVNEALRPPEATADWRTRIDQLRAEGRASGADPIAQGLEGLTVVAARHEEEAAAVAALLLRETLETPGLTCALVTPDQALARRVSARLARFGVEADSSAGAPLAGFPVAVLTALVADAAAGSFDPAATLAILKHPLTRLGLAFDEARRPRRDLERHGLRGPRRAGLAAVDAHLAAEAARVLAKDEPDHERAARLEAARDLSARLAAALSLAAAPFVTAPFANGEASVPAAARALAEALEALATDEHGRPRGLWNGPEGESAAGFLAGLMAEGQALGPVSAPAFAEIVRRLLDAEVVRTHGASHPRLRILGAIEARLVRADRLVLAGLEEGVWPQPAQTDPFLSRPMRAALGLPPPERRLGLAAHDFAQAACAPEVTIIHSAKRGGSPAVESRWLWRLRTLARGADLPLPGRPEVLDWARGLDAPLTPAPPELMPARRPCPKPPIEVRPIELPVTGVETWVRDPYALYARRILKLSPLDRPDEPVEARLRGSAIHAAFERFALDWPDALPDHPEAVFRDLLLGALSGAGMPEPAMARERALADNLAPWVIGFERRRRAGATLHVEVKGARVLEVDGAPFTLTAKADRIEARGRRADILDFKTGGAPSLKEVAAGLAPQLTLSAAILEAGGFEGVGKAEPGELIYVRVPGREPPGQECAALKPDDREVTLADALSGLIRRIRAFRDPARGYLSKAAPKFMNQASDYDQLARVFEWHVMGDAGDAVEGEG